MKFADMAVRGLGRYTTGCFASPRWIAAIVIIFAEQAFADTPAGMQSPQTVVARLSVVFNAFWAVLAPVMASFSSIPEELETSIRTILASSTTSGKGELWID